MNRYLQLFFSLLKLVSMPLLNFLTLFLGIKFYGKENWGEFISISIWIFFIAFIAKWSGQNYLIKEFSKNTSNYLNIFYSNILERCTLLLPSIVLFFIFPFSIACSSFLLILLIFIYNSYDVLLVYKNKLELQLTTEITGILIVIIGFFLFPIFNLTTILYLFCLSFFAKISILFFCFNHSFKKIIIVFSFKNILTTYPFFLIGFSGWLASKSDIYVVSYFFTKKELSEYQMLISCFLILQAIPAYLVLPINKHLFRMSDNSIKKIKIKLLGITIPVVAIFSLTIWFCLKSFMQIEYDVIIYFLISISTIPTFIYIIDILQLIRNNKEKAVMKFSFIIVALNLTLLLMLVPHFKILGAIISVCISQWLYLFFVNIEINKSKKQL